MRPLPILGALAHAIRSVSGNLGFAWHVSWPWLVILFPVSVAVESILPAVNPEATDAASMAQNAQAGFGYMALGLLSMLVFSSIAVNWHRYILLDEVPQGAARLRLDSLVWRYFGNTLLVILIVLAVSVPLALVISLVTVLMGLGSGTGGSLTGAILALLAIPLSYRLMVKLPAIAIGDRNFTMRQAFEKTRGNSFQLFIAGVIVIACAMVIGFVVGALAEQVGGGGGSVLPLAAAAVQQLVSWVVTIFTVTYLTSLYGFFVEGRDF